MLTLVLAALLAQATPPYPAPKLVPVADRLNCDFGPVLSLDPAKGELRLTTPAGVVTYKVSEAQVIGADGKPKGGAGTLSVGQRVRVYYVLEDGAKVSEIDLE